MADDNEEHNEETADRDLFPFADIIDAYVRCQSNPMHAQEWIFLTEKGLNAEPNYFHLVVTISQYSTSRFIMCNLSFSVIRRWVCTVLYASQDKTNKGQSD